MRKIIIIDGYYGSGKTTYCKNFLLEHNDYNYINIDSLCSKFRGDQEQIECEVINLVNCSDSHIIIDFYFKNRWKPLLNNIKNIKNVEIKYIFMQTSIEESYKRFIKRNQFTTCYISFNEYCKRLDIDIK